MPKQDKVVAEIARDELGIDTLETRNNDGLDFHELSVASIKTALEAAYEAGRKAGYDDGYDDGWDKGYADCEETGL